MKKSTGITAEDISNSGKLLEREKDIGVKRVGRVLTNNASILSKFIQKYSALLEE